MSSAWGNCTRSPYAGLLALGVACAWTTGAWAQGAAGAAGEIAQRGSVPLAAGTQAGKAGAAVLAEPLRFRRVYAPASFPEAWPRNQAPYFPMQPEEFERLLAQARASAQVGAPSATAAIASAQFTARLIGERLVEGHAALEVVCASERRATLNLQGCGLAITKAAWAGPTDRPAEIGLSAGGDLAVVVEKPGILRWDWSLGGRRGPEGVLEFVFGFPPCPCTSLLLDLPEKTKPRVDRGIAAREPEAGQTGNRWRIELGGHSRLRLAIVPDNAVSAPGRPARLRQMSVYEFSPKGVEVSVQLQLDLGAEPLYQLVVALDPGLKLVNARYGTSALRWSSMGTPSEGSRARFVLELPEPVQGAGRMVRLGLVAPLHQDAPWQLPGVRVEGASWQEGGATLRVFSPLVIQQLTPIEARQVKMGPLPAPWSGESFELQFFSPDASAQLVLSQPQAPVDLTSGTSVVLGGGEITAQVVADFALAEGELFQIDAELARQWIVDAVEAIPAEALEDWTVERPEDGPARLSVRLAKPLASDRPIQLRLVGRRLLSPVGRWLEMHDLVPVRFRATGKSRRLVSLHAVEPYRLTTSGIEQLVLLDPQGLDPAAARLLSVTSGSMVLEDDAASAALRVSLEAQRPKYAATIRVDAVATENSLIETYRFRCIPAGAPLEHVAVGFSVRRGEPLRWTLAGSGGEPLSARRLPDELPSPAKPASEEETWEVLLRQPQSLPFEICATRTIPLARRQPISLASLPQATSQRGILVVSSTTAAPLRVETTQMEPISGEAVPAEQYSTARATYRYYPAHNGAAEATVVLLPQDSAPPLPGAWVWNCRLESRYGASGTGQHLVVYQAQSSGRRQIQLTFPADVRLEEIRGVWVDQSRAVWRVVGRKGQRRLAVDLPAGRRFPVVWLQFTTSGDPLGVLATLAPPLPIADVPVLAQQWTVWLPPGYQAADLDPTWQASRAMRPTWRELLFGPLAQRAEEPLFDLFEVDHWAGVIGRAPARHAALAKARRVLQWLGESAPAGSQERGAGRDRWGDLLASPELRAILADRSHGGAAMGLWVDRQALARLGFGPGTLVHRTSTGSPAARGAAMLQCAELALLVHPEAIILTSALAASLDHAMLDPTEYAVVQWMRPGPLADRVHRAIQGVSDAAFVPADAWKNQGSDSTGPWVAVRPVGLQTSDLVGWSAYQIDLPAKTPVRLPLVHQSTVAALRWISFLAAVGLAGWWFLDRPLVLTALAGIFGAAALLAPSGWAEASSGAMLGSLCGLAFRLICCQAREAVPGAAASRWRWWPWRLRGKGSGGAAVLVAAFLALSVCSVARADALQATPTATASSSAEVPSPAAQAAPPAPSPPPKPTPAPTAPAPPELPPPAAPAGKPATGLPVPATPVYQVLIPVDEENKPTGEAYQVPEGFYKELHRRAGVVPEEPRGWLLTGAAYHGTLAWQGTPERLVPGELKARLELLVFNAATRVRLRLGGQGANLLPEGASLDGRMIQPEWEEEGNVLALDVANPGRYQLELSLRPTPQAGEESNGFELSIPPLATSQLELSVPPNAPPIEVPSALGAVVQEADPPRVVAALGPSPRLSVRWHDRPGQGAAGSKMDVEELLWLKVQPDAVVLDVRLKVRVLEGRVQALRLAADPRLRLLPVQGVQPAVEDGRTSSGPLHMIVLSLARPVSDQLELALSFLLTDTSGIGNLGLPRCEVLDARTTKRWLAVWVDPSLQHAQQMAAGMETLAVPAFAAAWGPAPLQPSFAFNLTSAEPSWRLTTRPRQARTTAVWTLAASFDLQVAHLHLDAHLKTSGGYNFQYRISAPVELEVEAVSVRAESSERVARWSRARDGMLTVFLAAPVTGEHRLSVQGRMPIGLRARVPLPTVGIEGAEVESAAVHLFRKPAVMVSVQGARGLTKIDSPVTGQAATVPGRWVSSFQVKGGEPIEASVVVSPNHPKIVAAQTTIVRFDGDQREASVRFEIRVEQGLADQWQLEVPPQWCGPYQVEPPAAIRVVEVPGSLRRRVLIEPAVAVTGDCRLTVSGPLSFAPSEHVGAPDIALYEAQVRRHVLILPTQSQLHPVVWETQGLKPVPLPEDFAAAPLGKESFVAYEVQRRPFRAALKPLVGEAQVFLADVSVTWRADGACHGVAVFDVQAAGLSQCPLRLPPGCHLLQLAVAGVPTTPLPSPNHRWQVPLSPSAFPQRIEVTFEGALPGPPGDGLCQFEAPVLEGLPVRQTLWTIAGPPQYQPRLPAGCKTLSRVAQEMVRLRAIGALMESAADTAAEDPEETVQWYRIWARRWAAAGEEIRRQLNVPGEDDTFRASPSDRQAILKELETLAGRQAPLAKRLGGDQAALFPPNDSPVNDSPSSRWLANLDPAPVTVRSVSEEGQHAIALAYDALEDDGRGSRVGGAVIVAIAVALVVGGACYRRLAGWVCRWPHALGVLVGLAWWLWLWPSALGWVIVLLSLAASFKPGWKPAPQSGSVVVMLSARPR